jgi:hypothetical protein
MTATTVHQHRPTLPLISMLVAGAAASISVIAITTDDVGPRPATAIVTPQPPAQEPPAAAPDQVRSTGAPAGDCLTRAPVVRC